MDDARASRYLGSDHGALSGTLVCSDLAYRLVKRINLKAMRKDWLDHFVKVIEVSKA